MKLQMGIVKVEIKMPELVKAVDEFKEHKVMEGLGENSLNLVLAFTAMKLQSAWQSTPVNDKRLLDLEKSQTRSQVTPALENLIH